MSSAVHRFDAAADAGLGAAPAAPMRPAVRTMAAQGLRLSLHTDLAALERDWRTFEQTADGTVFQTWGWLSVWQRTVGTARNASPAVIVGRGADGAPVILIPLMVERAGALRVLSFLGSDLCDYNGPLLAPDFTARGIDFPALWQAALTLIRAEPAVRFDLVRLEKLPEQVGAQPNPLLALPTQLNPSGGWLTHLGTDWETYYARRSTSTRRGDRTKRRKLATYGDLAFVTADSDAEVQRTLDVLMAQKAQAFAFMGVPNLFDRPGYREFYRTVTTDPASRALTHVSRLEIGESFGATNLGLTFRGRYYHVLVSYDGSDVSRYGPGMAHLMDLMQRAIETRHSIYDFTIGDERYKSDWCEVNLALHDHVQAASLRGALASWPLTQARKLRRFIKQNPALWAAVSRARALAARLRTKA